jgi:hypothetical protein
VTAKVEGIRKRCTAEVEEDLNIMEIGIYYTVATHREEWWRILLEVNVHNGKKSSNSSSSKNLEIQA